MKGDTKMVSADIKLGDWVIIVTRPGHDRSYLNEPLEVVSIDGDLVLCKRQECWSAGDVIINTAVDQIRRLSDDFKANILKMREEFRAKELSRDLKAFSAADPEA